MIKRRDVFHAIADPTRRSILTMVAHKNLKMNELAKKFDSSRPTISKHIKVLVECGLIVIEKQGRERYCHLELQKLSEVSDWLEPFRQLLESRFKQLDNLLNELQEKRNKL